MDVSREIVVDLPAAELWQLLTDGDELSTWLGGDVSFAAEPGAEGKVVDGDVTRRLRVDGVEPPRRLAFVWWPEGEPQHASRVEFTLDEDGEGTTLVVTESAPVAVPEESAGGSPEPQPQAPPAQAMTTLGFGFCSGRGAPDGDGDRRGSASASVAVSVSPVVRPPTAGRVADRLIDLEWRCLASAAQRQLVGSGRR